MLDSVIRSFVGISIISCLLLTSGCDLMVPPWQLSDLKHAAKRPVTCDAGKDCTEKWARALQWVKKNSRYPIETKSNDLIKTEGSSSLSPFPAFTNTKVEDNNNIYTIRFEGYCDDSFGCSPPLLELKASFVNFVMGSPKSN